jgi:hypothetical protein
LRAAIVGLSLALVGTASATPRKGVMDLSPLLAAVRNDRIKVGTMRPPGSKFAVLERRVLIGGPPELVQLSEIGELRVLDELLPLLKDPARAWAANAMLAKMTRTDEKQVDTWQSRVDEWWGVFGKGAFERWSRWLAEHRDHLRWNATEHYFATQ